MKYGLMTILMFLFSCQDKTPQELDLMYNAVMEVHDEVMPKMRDINRGKKALRKIENSALDSLIADAIVALDDADEAMMAWMAQFKKPDPEDLPRAKAYYEEQMMAIQEVKDQMLSAIDNANKIVEQNQ